MFSSAARAASVAFVVTLTLIQVFAPGLPAEDRWKAWSVCGGTAAAVFVLTALVAFLKQERNSGK